MKTKTRFLLMASLVFATTLTISCGGSKPPIYPDPVEVHASGKPVYNSTSGKPVFYGLFTHEGEAYGTIEMPDGKVWMAQNLRYKTENSKCPYNKCSMFEGSNPYMVAYSTTFYRLHGLYYNWEEAMKACPAGWHLPTKEEWDAMVAAIGGEEVEGIALRAKTEDKKYAGFSFFAPYGLGLKGSDSYDTYGFKLLANGWFSPEEDTVKGIFTGGFWWLASEANADSAYVRALSYLDDNERIMNKRAAMADENIRDILQKERKEDGNIIRSKAMLHNVRCVRD